MTIQHRREHVAAILGALPYRNSTLEITASTLNVRTSCTREAVRVEPNHLYAQLLKFHANQRSAVLRYSEDSLSCSTHQADLRCLGGNLTSTSVSVPTY